MNKTPYTLIPSSLLRVPCSLPLQVNSETKPDSYITGVKWENYEALLNDLGDSLQYRVTYLDGVIESAICNSR
ncbi:hypothetical protein [Anabaena lutea]|uniref:hypothetical protein n=1 Tax=Anabaena lutea TaxID=212350 RepID=UPI001681F4DC|nr:hypothetical protein [Anabaena lutea]